MCTGIVLLSFLYVLGAKLLKKLEATQENGQILENQGEFKAAIMTMKRVLFIIKLYLPSMILPVIMAPIWMGVTSTATNPGMEDSFYMLVFVDELFLVLAFPAYIHGVLYTSLKMAGKKVDARLEEEGYKFNIRSLR